MFKSPEKRRLKLSPFPPTNKDNDHNIKKSNDILSQKSNESPSLKLGIQSLNKT